MSQPSEQLVGQSNQGNGQYSNRGFSHENPQEKFRRQRPKEFSGTSDPLEAESWIKSLEVIFEYLQLADLDRAVGIGRLAGHLSGTCAWLQPVFQEPGASRLIAVDSSIRSTTRLETPSSDCTRSPDEIGTIGFSTKN
ncbi:hypothetical protein F511_19210 [Dorcoceras hygrometricum]|uniref:Uncharacterized protein n=1 Tax=Dorcoceras hygrometricum TaxID=472368 RepID=A0A2Z7C4F1_9LAMI|nr:hypothetical protein F511_19210 [Dorcoceras hygrometricum]